MSWREDQQHLLDERTLQDISVRHLPTTFSARSSFNRGRVRARQQFTRPVDEPFALVAHNSPTVMVSSTLILTFFQRG